MRNRLLCLIREPFVEKIPSLRALLEYLSEDGFEIDLLSPVDPAYPAPSFLNKGIRFHQVAPGIPLLGRRVRVPTCVRMLATGLQVARKVSPGCVLGAGKIGMCVGLAVAHSRGIPLVAFCVEYPQARANGQRLSWADSAEHLAVRTARMVITFDAIHAGFISAITGAARDRFALLPNGTRGEPGRTRSTLLADCLAIPKDAVIVLHSGGLGKWFASVELARAATRWPSSWYLVFHTSYRLGSDPYLRAVETIAASSTRIRFSLEPVSMGELGGLVSSAHVGVATYSREELGYRAELMGLAAGKIGMYLKCGLPVVASDLPSIRQYLGEYESGICVGHPEEIRGAIERILADYARYSANAIRCYEELWAPDRYCACIAERLRCFVR